MKDSLIRDVPEEVIAAIDAKAKRVGLSLTEYLRRALERERQSSPIPVSVVSLQHLTAISEDLDDNAVISSAWS